ncbi:MAG: FxsA family protein [Deltaproteobacteria bacterium]|nr:FxsA family protein [Deltaproteobacteria bacterium]
MASLLLLFIVVPAVELALLIEVGTRIGTPATIAIIVGTGIVGAALAKQQGLRTIQKIQAELDTGALPTSALVDGVIILIAGALLVTPGLLTDVAGFMCLVPVTRALVKRTLQRRFERAIKAQHIEVTSEFYRTGPSESPPIHDVTPDGPPGREPRKPLQ